MLVCVCIGMRCKFHLPLQAVLIGKDSAFYSEAMERGLGHLVGPKNVIALEGAGHHVYLDQPRQFVHELQQLLSRWAELDN